MFSRQDVAYFINLSFEPVWESVRPVPLVHIDFGNGTVLTRTLHGNIATYVCSAEGQVLDILPGIYEPKTYLSRLGQFRLLADYVDQLGKDKREARLKEYHQGQAEALKKNEPPAAFINMAFMSKSAIENGLKAALLPAHLAKEINGATGGKAPIPEKPRLENKEDVASWKVLAEDTEVNETVRRRHIHEMLLTAGLVRPEQVVRPLYKDVLHADLDDPYLGLGETLFASYPFRDEKPH